MPSSHSFSPVRPAIVIVALAAAGAWLWQPARHVAKIPPPSAASTAGGRFASEAERIATRKDQASAPAERARCERALSLTDPERRAEAVRAALLAWSQSDPAAALRWADGCGDDLRSCALSTVAEALSAQPERAVAIGRTWWREHPESADEVGAILIGALVRRDAFDAALQLATSGPAPSSEAWCCNVVDTWAQRDPARALDLAEALQQQGAPETVFAALAHGWAQSAPEQLLAYGLTLPPGADRAAALSLGLDQWLFRDPTAAGSWIRQFGDPHEHDQALTRYLTRTDQVERSTSTALAMADEITDPTLHFTAVEHLMRELAADHHADIARRYVAMAVGLDPQQRRQLVADLGPTAD